MLISSIKTIGLISSALCSVIASVLISLRSAAPVLGKKLAARMSAFAELLPIRGSSIDLLRSGRWGSAFATLAFLLHFDRIHSPLLWAGSYIVEFNMPAYPGLYPSFLVFVPKPRPKA